MAVLVDNRKASFSYELQDKYEAGLELFGYEVKSLKNRRGNLSGSYVVIRGNEAFLIGLDIPPYQANNTPDAYNQLRPRKLLLTKKELRTLTEIDNRKGLTLVPISLYTKGRNIKLELASVRGKKKTDKRETIKERDTKRDIQRILKYQDK
jgi:SsrA-binding protein